MAPQQRTVLLVVVGYYMFDISFKNLVQGIPLSGARTPREGGLIDSRRHLRARAEALAPARSFSHPQPASSRTGVIGMTDSSHPLLGSALLLRAG